MDFTWLQSLLYGFLAGLTEIFPVSAQVHKVLLVKFFGTEGTTEFLDFIIHTAVLGGLYVSCRGQLVRISRARALARIPKNRRKRPLDIRTLMDVKLLQTMLIPVIPALFAYQWTFSFKNRLILLSAFLFLNGVMLYVPQFLPSGNKDARNMSHAEGFFIGLGGAAAVLPGISAIGASTSIASVCGADRSYSLNMALLMDMVLTAGFLVVDLIAVFTNGVGTFSFLIFLRYLISAGLAFAATLLAVRLLRMLAAKHTFALFGLYSFGVALFTFILNLMA